MKVSTRASIEVDRAPEAVFAYATTAENIPRYFRGFGPVPAVAKSYLISDGPPRRGALRRVITADGVSLDEAITEHEPPRLHAYRVSGFKAPLRFLAAYAESELVFAPSGAGTRVTWTYSITARSVLAVPLVAVLTRTALKRAIEQALVHIKAAR